MQVWHSKFIIMPSQRKRIGFLPSEEVHEIIDKLCRANEFSQSKVTGLLVEEALKSRGILSDSFNQDSSDKNKFNSYSFEHEPISNNNNSLGKSNEYKVNRKILADDIKMMYEYIEFKYFKNVMKQNNNIFE